MPGGKLPILTITNKQYWRDDGLYIYSSADGQLDIVADSTISLNGNVSLVSGKTLTIANDGVTCSSNAGSTNLWDHTDNISGNATGWLKVTAGLYTGYIPIFSGNSIL